MKELRQSSNAQEKRLELTAPAAVSSGDFLVIGQLPVIAVADVASGEKGTFIHKEVIEYAKESTTATFAEGDVVYFDVSADEMTNTSDTGTNKVVGYALKAAVAADPTVLMVMAERIADA